VVSVKVNKLGGERFLTDRGGKKGDVILDGGPNWIKEQKGQSPGSNKRKGLKSKKKRNSKNRVIKKKSPYGGLWGRVTCEFDKKYRH